MPVGLSPDTIFQEVEVAMKPGDRVYLYTDGLIEARGRDGIIVGTEGLESIVGSTGAMDLGGSLDHILAEVARYSEGIQIDDDVVIIGLEGRITGRGLWPDGTISHPSSRGWRGFRTSVSAQAGPTEPLSMRAALSPPSSAVMPARLPA